MNLRLLTGITISLFFFVCCSQRSDADIFFDQVESLMLSQEDSALRLLNSHPDIAYNRETTAKYALLYTEALHRNEKKVYSDSLINIALEYYQNLNKPDYLAKACFYKGEVYATNDNWKAALEIWLKAEILAKKTDNHRLLGLIYSHCGIIYDCFFNREKSLIYYNKATDAFLKAKDSANVMINLPFAAECYFRLNKPDSAIILCNQALTIEKTYQNSRQRNYIRGLLMEIYKKKKDYNQVYNIYNEVLNEKEHSFNRSMLLCHYHKFMENTDSALYYLHQALDKPHILTQRQRLGVLNTYYSLEEKSAHYKEALNYAKKYIKLNDTIHQKEKEENVLHLEEQFKNKLLASQNKQLIAENRIRRILFYFIITSVCTVIIILYRKYKRMTKEKNAKIDLYLSTIEELKLNHKNTINMFVLQLNDKDSKEQQLKNAHEKRLSIIKQLTEISTKYSGKKFRDTFYTKVSELMKKDMLTKATLQNLCDVVNINYYGVIDFLKNKFTSLTSDELEWCAFLCSGFLAQELSIIYGVSTNYYYVKNNRISNKMDIDISLSQYLKDYVDQQRSIFEEEEKKEEE